MRQFTFIFGAVVLILSNLSSAAAGEKPQPGTFADRKESYVGVLGKDGLTARRSVFSYTDGAEEVVGTTTSIYFVLDLPAKQVWPVFQDFNLWQNAVGFTHSGVYGDKEGELEFLIYNGPRETATLNNTMAFVVQQLVPEHFIVLHSPPWEGIDKAGNKLGVRHEGKNVFMLTEVEGKTVVTASMEHVYSHYGDDAKNRAKASLEQRVGAAKARKKEVWDSFVSALKKAIEDSMQ